MIFILPVLTAISAISGANDALGWADKGFPAPSWLRDEPKREVAQAKNPKVDGDAWLAAHAALDADTRLDAVLVAGGDRVTGDAVLMTRGGDLLRVPVAHTDVAEAR